MSANDLKTTLHPTTTQKDLRDFIRDAMWLGETEKAVLIAMYNAGKVFECIWSVRHHPKYVQVYVRIDEEN